MNCRSCGKKPGTNTVSFRNCSAPKRCCLLGLNVFCNAALMVSVLTAFPFEKALLKTPWSAREKSTRARAFPLSNQLYSHAPAGVPREREVRVINHHHCVY